MIKIKATGIPTIPDYQTVNEENKREGLLNSLLTKSGLIQITGFVMARLLGLLLLLVVVCSFHLLQRSKKKSPSLFVIGCMRRGSGYQNGRRLEIINCTFDVQSDVL